MNKAQARTLLKEARAQVEDRARKEARMNGALLGFAPLRQAGTLFVYRAFGAEPPTQALIEALLRQGKRVCLPRVEGREMLAVPIGPDSAYRRGSFGILEPLGQPIPPEEVDLVVCPGLGFGRDGSRLGYGGGFYDRFLKKTAALRVGLCYNACIWQCVPAEEEDEKMHYLVSEAGVTSCREGKT